MKSISDLVGIKVSAHPFISIPKWIDEDIDMVTLSRLMESGCAANAYINFADAKKIMDEHGEDVMSYLQLHCLVPRIDNAAWCDLPLVFLSAAIEAWAAEFGSMIESDGNNALHVEPGCLNEFDTEESMFVWLSNSTGYKATPNTAIRAVQKKAAPWIVIVIEDGNRVVAKVRGG